MSDEYDEEYFVVLVWTTECDLRTQNARDRYWAAQDDSDESRMAESLEKMDKAWAEYQKWREAHIDALGMFHDVIRKELACLGEQDVLRDAEWEDLVARATNA